MFFGADVTTSRGSPAQAVKGRPGYIVQFIRRKSLSVKHVIREWCLIFADFVYDCRPILMPHVSDWSREFPDRARY